MALSEGLEFRCDLDIKREVPFSRYHQFSALDVLVCIKVLPLSEKFEVLCFVISCVNKANYINDQILSFVHFAVRCYLPCNNCWTILFIICPFVGNNCFVSLLWNCSLLRSVGPYPFSVSVFRGGGFNAAKCIPGSGYAIAITQRPLFALVILPCSQMSCQQCLLCWLKLWLSRGPRWTLPGKLKSFLEECLTKTTCNTPVCHCIRPCLLLHCPATSLGWICLKFPGFLLGNINIVLLKISLPTVHLLPGH